MNATLRTTEACLTAVVLLLAAGGTAAAAPCSFTVGDTLLGEIHERGDVDTCTFEAVRGTLLRIVVRPDAGSSLRPQVRLVDPDGQVVVDYGQRVFMFGSIFFDLELLAKDGPYTLSIRGGWLFGRTGAYVVTTGARFPAIEGARQATISVPAATDEFSFRAVRLSIFSVDLTSYGLLQGKFVLVLPDNSTLGPATTIPSGVTPLTGLYTIRVFGDSGTTGDYALQWDGTPPSGTAIHTEGAADAW